MKFFNVFLYEFHHFRRSTAKVLTYLIFVFACVYSIYSGFDLQNKQKATIEDIEFKQQQELLFVSNFFNKLTVLPAALDVLGYIPISATKKPSPLMPLGIGQAEQYGYYKNITNWSSTYDNDMVEEIANPERLVNGNIDFSFLVIFLLPILIIIMTYNIKGLEQDFRFDKLIKIQYGSVSQWIFIRFSFYILLLLLTVIFFMVCVAVMNNAIGTYLFELTSLIFLLVGYILFFAAIFYFIVLRSYGSSAIAFKMISIWLLLCVIIPGAVHQFASIVHPAHYMTDYLDANREEAYEVFELPLDSVYLRLFNVYPNLSETKHAKTNELNRDFRRNAISAIVNNMNKIAIEKIEEKNSEKNQLIRATYWFNPVSYVQNQWNHYTATDYYSYRDYRIHIQATLDTKLRLLNFESWDERKVTVAVYENYLKELNVVSD
jgi:ABC-2 type transport system permease protein